MSNTVLFERSVDAGFSIVYVVGLIGFSECTLQAAAARIFFFKLVKLVLVITKLYTCTGVMQFEACDPSDFRFLVQIAKCRYLSEYAGASIK